VRLSPRYLSAICVLLVATHPAGPWTPAEEVERLVAPWVDGSRDLLAKLKSPALAGHLVFAELADRAEAREVYVEAVRRPADTGFTDTGTMKESMPHHDDQPRVDAAWHPVVSRIGDDRVLFDVGESTNQQPSLEAYLRRAAILDREPRGGGMAMLFATEWVR